MVHTVTSMWGQVPTKIPLTFRETSAHSNPFEFPHRQARDIKDCGDEGRDDQPRPPSTTDFESSERCHTQREAVAQPPVVPRWLTTSVNIKFQSWLKCKLAVTGLFSPKCCNNDTVLQFTSVPHHSGYNSGKWFTKVTKDNCLSLFSTFWSVDISGCFHL